jgi:DNA polymerase
MLYSIVLDFETWSPADLKKVGAWVYAEHPLTRILCLSYWHNGQIKTWRPGEPADELRLLALDPKCTFIAFNCAFERAIWKHCMAPFPEVPLERWHDIQATAAAKGLPQNLEDLAEVLHISQKDLEGSNLTSGLSKMNKKTGLYPEITPEILDRVCEYCEADVEVEAQAHAKLGFLGRMDRRDWLLTQATNERGVAIDLLYVNACRVVADDAAKDLLREFHDITGLKPTQGQKFIEWLEAKGFQPPPNARGDGYTLGRGDLVNLIGSALIEEEGDEREISARDALGRDVAPDVLRALRIRQLTGASSLGKLSRMQICTGSDGRSRGLLHWHGTGPGRAAGRLWQPQNLPKPTLKAADGEPLEPDHLVRQIMTHNHAIVAKEIGPPVHAVVSGMRHAIVPGPGRVFISGDYAGIQARLVLAVAGQLDKCDMMAKGRDVYIDMGEQIFSRPLDKHKDPWERGIGKNSVLGLGFQMGAKTFRDKYVTSHPVLWDAEDRLVFCQTVVQAYRKKWAPLVPKVWYALQGAAEDAVILQKPQHAYGVTYAVEGDWLSAMLPSGRKIWYYKPTVYFNRQFEKDAIRVLSLEGGRLVTDSAMFGGRLTENVIMGMEHDLMTIAKDKCEQNGLPVALEVHDEILVEPLTKDADEKAFKQIMLDIPDWAKKIQVPINIDMWTGDRYRKG